MRKNYTFQPGGKSMKQDFLLQDEEKNTVYEATVTDKKGNIWGRNATGHLEYKRNTGELHYVHSDSLGCTEGLKTLLCMINIQEEYAKAFVRITDEYPSIYALCKDCQKNCVIKSSWDRS